MINIRKKRSYWGTFLKNKSLLLMTLPALVYFLVFHYLPMGGMWMAFTNYRYSDGIFGSEFIGLHWFRTFLDGDLSRVTINTVSYGIAFIILGVITGVFTAVLFNELKSRTALKAYQTIMILPFFMSWVVVALILYLFLDPMFGVINTALEARDLPYVMWYNEPKYWPFILSFMNIWKGVGMGAIIYFAAIMGIDPSLYEAATIDGAGKIARIRYITLPGLIPIIVILTIMACGNIFRGDFGLFFAVPNDSGALMSTTDILDTYIYRGLKFGQLSLNT